MTNKMKCVQNIAENNAGINFGIDNQKGMVLALVMAFIALMMISVLSLSSMIQRDSNLIERIRDREQARFMAEAGINYALANIKANGFGAATDFSGSMDTGSYNVTFSSSGGRILVYSVGTVGSISMNVSAEIEDNTPTAMNYFSGAGNNIWMYSFVANALISGDIHANNNVTLYSGFIFAWLQINGNVSATGIVKEGSKYNQDDWLWDNHVSINGVANDGAAVGIGSPMITFPTFDFEAYRQDAIDSGDYYLGDQVFNSQTFSPGNGIVYVDGNVTINGTCVINGGLVADSITIVGVFNQTKVGNRNVIMTTTGDIGILGKLYVDEALVYAAQDIRALAIGADVEVNGIMLAKRDINMWNFLTKINYTYVAMSPADMAGANGEEPFVLVSWNT